MPRRKLRRPKELTVEPKVKVLRRYPKEKCSVEGCEYNAVGKGDTCKKHGGDPIIPENLLQECEIPSATLLSTKYEPAVHPMSFITLSRDGMSDTEIAADFGVSVGTLRGWAERYADFSVAYEIGKDMHEAWWIREGKDNLDNRGYNTGLFKFLTGNKLGYSDKMESKNLNVTAGVLLVPNTMTKEEWEKNNGAS